MTDPPATGRPKGRTTRGKGARGRAAYRIAGRVERRRDQPFFAAAWAFRSERLEVTGLVAARAWRGRALATTGDVGDGAGGGVKGAFEGVVGVTIVVGIGVAAPMITVLDLTVDDEIVAPGAPLTAR